MNREGLRASVKDIRKRLGRGSYSTIQAFLDTWVPENQIGDLPPMPPLLFSVVSPMTADFWYLAQKTAEETVASATAAVAKERDEAISAAALLGEQLDKSKLENSLKDDQIIAKDQTIEKRDQQIVGLTEKVRNSEKVIGKQAAEIEVLTRTLGELGPLVAMLATSKKLKASVARSAKPTETPVRNS